EVLLRRRLFLYKGLKTIDVLLRFEEIRLSLCKVCLCLKQDHLLRSEFPICFTLRKFAVELLDFCFVGPQIQHVEDLARLNVGTRFEEALFDITIHAATDLDHIARESLRSVLAVYRNIFVTYPYHRNFGSRRGGSRVGGTRTRTAARQ